MDFRGEKENKYISHFFRMLLLNFELYYLLHGRKSGALHFVRGLIVWRMFVISYQYIFFKSLSLVGVGTGRVDMMDEKLGHHVVVSPPRPKKNNKTLPFTFIREESKNFLFCVVKSRGLKKGDKMLLAYRMLCYV